MSVIQLLLAMLLRDFIAYTRWKLGFVSFLQPESPFES